MEKKQVQNLVDLLGRMKSLKRAGWVKRQVKNPDVYTLDENSIINDLITLAGGVTENADLSSINRAKKLQNHEMIYIADKNETSIAQNSMADPSEHSVMSESLVDINTAEAEQLKTLNGIGDSKAKSIIEYREQNGGFKSIEEKKNVTGIGDALFDKIVVPTSITNAQLATIEGMTITVNAYAIQADGFETAAEAWAAFGE